MNNTPSGGEGQEDLELHETVADLQKTEFIRFLQENAVVPFRLINSALRHSELMRFDKKTIKCNPYWEAVQLYVWMQHLKASREIEGKLVDNELYASPSYIMKGLNWGKARYRRAIGVLKKYHLISRHVKEWRNEETGRIKHSQTWWAVWN